MHMCRLPKLYYHNSRSILIPIYYQEQWTGVENSVVKEDKLRTDDPTVNLCPILSNKVIHALSESFAFILYSSVSCTFFELR